MFKVIGERQGIGDLRKDYKKRLIMEHMKWYANTYCKGEWIYGYKQDERVKISNQG